MRLSLPLTLILILLAALIAAAAIFLLLKRLKPKRLKQLWQHSTLNKVIILGLLAFVLLLAAGYSQLRVFSWVGFGDYTKPRGVDERGKTLWDWLELLVIPAVLAAVPGGYSVQSVKSSARLLPRGYGKRRCRATWTK